jgi:hypothetical protein
MTGYADPGEFIARLKAEPNHDSRYVVVRLERLRPKRANSQLPPSLPLYQTGI